MSDANNSEKPQVDPYWKAKLESLKALVKATAEVAEAKAIAAANAKAAIALVGASELEAAILKEAAAAEEALVAAAAAKNAKNELSWVYSDYLCDSPWDEAWGEPPQLE